MTIPQRKGSHLIVSRYEHPRETSLEALSGLKPLVKPDGTVTAGNSSGINDGAAALIIGSEAAAQRHGLNPRARILAMTTVGVAPGIGPWPATEKILAQTGLTIGQIDVIELNEAFAS